MSVKDKVRVGVIGAGGMAHSVHLPSLGCIPEAEVVAICDLVPERAKEAAAKHHIPRVYPIHAEMLEHEVLDAVLCLCEPDRQFRPAYDALSVGKHVMLEKPPGLTLFQARTLMRAAREHNCIVQVAFNRRFIPLVQEVLARMRNLTTVNQVVGHFMKHGTAAFCDGSISAFESDTIHVLDWVRWVAGGNPVAGAMLESRFGDVVPNAWNAVVRFDNGVAGVIKANYMTGGRTHMFEVHGPHASAFIDVGFGSATCSARILVHGSGGEYSLAAKGAGENQTIELDGIQLAGSREFYAYYGFLQENQEFIAAVREGRPRSCDIEDGVKAFEFAEFLNARRLA